MRKQLLGSVIFALLFLVGCQSPATFGGIPRKKIYRPLVSLSPSTSEMVGTAGVPLSGRTKACNYPDTISNAEVVADLKPNYEAITKLHPALIVVDRDLFSDAEVAKMKETGAEVVQYGSNTVEGYLKEFYEMGNLISGEININEYVVKVQKQVKASLGEPPATPQKAVMIIPDSSGHHMIAGNKSFQSVVVRIIGATLAGPNSQKFEMLNPEFLISENPDVIFVAGDAKGLISDPRFANLKAIKGSKLVLLDQDICLRRGGRVDQFIYSGHKRLLLAVGESK
jgi:ABC-type Fe3+-hydroxamate transport system substrate-binding protein